MTRLFGNEKDKLVVNGNLTQNGVGKMNDFTSKALQSIKKLGVTHIWYTGIIEHATCEQYPKYKIKKQNPSVVKGRAGSPYAITDYYDVNPYLAENIPNRIKEFEQLVERTHKNKLKVIIDFVPNHVARQYHSDVYPENDFGINDDNSVAFSVKNDFYYIPNEHLHLVDGMGSLLKDEQVDEYKESPAKATGNDQFSAYPTKDDWYETVKFNYGVDYANGNKKHFEPKPLIWDKMVDILKYWCSKNVDGIRCDMAEMVPVEFWSYAISKVKKEYPNVIFIAEVYNPNEYHNYINTGGFDYLYDKVGLYDTLRDIISFDYPARNITHCWENLDGIDSKMLRFLENHDEQRIASSFFTSNPGNALPAMVVSATLNTGPIMTYFGQEVGEPANGMSGYSGDDGRTTIFDFFNIPELQKWRNKGKFNGKMLSVEQESLRNYYSKLLNFSISNRAISEGKFYDLMWANNFAGGPNTNYIYSYLRYYGDECLLIVVNFNKNKSEHFKLKIPEHAFQAMDCDVSNKISFKDELSEVVISEVTLTQIAYEGINIDIPILGSFIFKIS